MCDLCTASTVPASDMLINNFPVSVCSLCRTALMMYSEPTDTLVDFTTDHVYVQRLTPRPTPA